MLRFAITLVLMVLIAMLSLTPGAAGPDASGFEWVVHVTPKLAQKLLHVVIYATLAVSLVWSIDPVARSRLRHALAFCVAVAFGALMEWGQTFVPGRFGSLTDILLNTLGVLTGLAVARIALRSTFASMASPGAEA